MSELNAEISNLRSQKKDEENNLNLYQERLQNRIEIKEELRAALQSFIKAKLPNEREENSKLIDEHSQAMSKNNNAIERLKSNIKITQENLQIIDARISKAEAEAVGLVRPEIMSILIKNASIAMLIYTHIAQVSMICHYSLFIKPTDQNKGQLDEQMQARPPQPPGSTPKRSG